MKAIITINGVELMPCENFWEPIVGDPFKDKRLTKISSSLGYLIENAKDYKKKRQMKKECKRVTDEFNRLSKEIGK